MKTRNPRLASALLIGATPFLLVGCKSAQPITPSEAAAASATPAAIPETQQIAEAVLGNQAEIISHGDLARNGSEQLLVVNRFKKVSQDAREPGNLPAIFVTRAVIVEKNNGKWAEVLRCDEHLKNQRGYLGGSPAAPVTGWRLDLKQDPDQGLELRFTPSGAGQEQSAGAGGAAARTIAVRWNKNAKRYQSLDQSHKGYLGDLPTLETPQSILK